jgi:hypothetical protein
MRDGAQPGKMKAAAMQPVDPGYVAAGLSRALPMHLRRDERFMESLGSLVGYLFHAAGLELK